MRKEKNSSTIELLPDIRNKLQTAMTVLESIKADKKVPDRLIEKALKDLDIVVKIIS